VPPNKHMQRAGTHKVLGRGRSSLLLSQVPLARVLMRRRAGADVGRSATFIRHTFIAFALWASVLERATANTVIPPLVPVELSASDRAALSAAACSPRSARTVVAWKWVETSHKVNADVVCEPHRIDRGHAVAHYTSCDRTDDPWGCVKGVERYAFKLPGDRIANLQIIDASVEDIERVLSLLGKYTLKGGKRAIAQIEGSWQVWGATAPNGSREYSFAPAEDGTRRFTLSLKCDSNARCKDFFAQHR
jgi:hypothetical protein